MMKPLRRARDADESRRLIWQAAAEAFASKGFDGAKVDDIARAAGVNKAMLYYHFADKAALFDNVLRDMFRAVSEAVGLARAAGGHPDDQIRAYVAALAAAAEARPHFPAIWLREIAEGGRHLNPDLFGELHAVLTTLREILMDGVARSGWRTVDPFLIQAGIAAPLMLILATRDLRARAGLTDAGVDDLPVLVDHFTEMTLATLASATRSPA